MANVILVHGLGATEKSWFDIPAALEAAGHSVEAVLLPGALLSGLDDFVATIVSAFPATGECNLIGHSMGGVSISQAAADHPSRVSKLIYVTALVPANGQSAGGLIGGLSTSFSAVDDEFQRLGIGPGHPARRIPVLGALRGSFQSSTGFAAIPKHYVRCSNDTTIKPAEQAEMIGKWAGTTESSMPSGHIPQKEVPDELAAALLAEII